MIDEKEYSTIFVLSLYYGIQKLQKPILWNNYLTGILLNAKLHYMFYVCSIGIYTLCSCVCLTDAYPLPQPGRLATRSSVSLTGQNVTLTMDSNTPGAYLRVCYNNRSSSSSSLSCCCCSCSTRCEWGELFSHIQKYYISCRLTTSQPGQYQFQIQTLHYRCYFDIGDPINVSQVNSNYSINTTHKFTFSYQLLSYSLGGLCVILVVGILAAFFFTRMYYKRRRYAQLGTYVDICII